MRVRIPGWRSGLATLVLMAAAAAATYGALALLGVPGGSETEPAVARVPGVRDRLAICVDVYDPAGELGPAAALLTAAKKSVEAALEEVKRNPLWLEMAYSRQPGPIVDAGCPSGPPERRDRLTGDRIPERVREEEKSYYYLFVFVVSGGTLEELQTSLMGWVLDPRARLAPQEDQQVGGPRPGAPPGNGPLDVGWETVTWATYVRPEELRDVSFMATRIEEALHFRDAGPVD